MVAPCVSVTVPLSDPVKLVKVMADVAFVAVPVRFVVIIPAEKFPFPSLVTIAEAVLL